MKLKEYNKEFNMDNEFRKDKLSNGCIVQLRNGDKCMYLENANNMCGKADVFIDINDSSWVSLESYDNQLKSKINATDYDVIKICNMNFVGDNIKKQIIVNTDEWTAVREENKEELDIDKLIKETKIKLEEFDKVLERYIKLKEVE